ncbi:MAG: methyl-accepting chemotaxis protein, partial [Myxococcales bacterium]|nr:methyl-accepting chemotaxis protein [Myxococcales bacterium]
LDVRFQLKYTLAVVAVTVAVAGVLGYFAYDFSRGQTEAFLATKAMQPDLDPAVAAQFDTWAEEADNKVRNAILLGILAMALTLGFTGIIVTHRMAGPIFKMKRLLREVAAGDLTPKPGLRKGDELQDLFEAFAEMVESMRERQKEEIAELDDAIEHAKKTGSPPEAIDRLQVLRGRMHAALGDPSDL